MLLLSLSRIYWAPNGYRILRPADRSCWILKHRESHCSRLFWTRRAAYEAAAGWSQAVAT